MTVGDLECETTSSSTDTEVLCSPPSLNDLQAYFEKHKQQYKIEGNNTERKKRDALRANNKNEAPKKTHFKVKVVMGNRELSPGSLDYKITDGALVESPVGFSSFF